MFLTRRFYIVLAAITIVTALGFAFPPLFGVGKFMLLLLAAALLADILMLFHKKGITARRDCADRFSNGDDNTIRIIISNTFALRLSAIIIDEAPIIFQRRNIKYHLPLPAKTTSETSYSLRPVVRGTYHFGRLCIFVRTPLTLVERRYTQAEEKEVKVYPSFLMLNHYELLAMSNNLLEMGIKRIRRVGNNTEFEQIKAYVPGDEYRTINWKASARRHELMVNVYRDERSQRIYSVIDKGRVMQQAFDKMTLLDYSINAALVLSHIAIRKDDKAGLITFAEKVDTMLAPSSRPTQMQHILEALYAEQTSFGETDFSALCTNINRSISKRSLLILYTNFSGLGSLHRQLAYLKLLNNRHRLLVVFFEDAELQTYISSDKQTTEDYYRHVIAEKFAYEQRLIVSTLQQHGILSLLTTPKNLSVDVINKYIELKQRQILS